MKGIYYLLISVSKGFKLKTGSLGLVDFKKGLYVYVGSGKGKRGGSELVNRVLRHLRACKKTRWHIDYLLSSSHVKIKGLCIIEGQCLSECDFIKKIAGLGVFIPGFGSSDCESKCGSHLIRLN
ncbi:MAG: GIY-YIG nuclease family protein [Candidatus Odinarchaeota archaeon]